MPLSTQQLLNGLRVRRISGSVMRKIVRSMYDLEKHNRHPGNEEASYMK